MRISTDEKDPGYSPDLPNDGIVITLDGFEVRDVDMADEEAGELRRAMRNADGELYCEGDEVAREMLRGKVVISLPPGLHLHQPNRAAP